MKKGTKKPRYTEAEKIHMQEKHIKKGESLREVAKQYGCSGSAVFYASFPDKYEQHREYVFIMKHSKH